MAQIHSYRLVRTAVRVGVAVRRAHPIQLRLVYTCRCSQLGADRSGGRIDARAPRHGVHDKLPASRHRDMGVALARLSDGFQEKWAHFATAHIGHQYAARSQTSEERVVQASLPCRWDWRREVVESSGPVDYAVALAEVLASFAKACHRAGPEAG